MNSDNDQSGQQNEIETSNQQPNDDLMQLCKDHGILVEDISDMESLLVENSRMPGSIVENAEKTEHNSFQINALKIENAWPLGINDEPAYNMVEKPEKFYTNENFEDYHGGDVPTLTTSKNPNAVKLEPEKFHKDWDLVDLDVPSTSNAEQNDTKNEAPVTKTAVDLFDILDAEFDLNSLENIMKENEKKQVKESSQDLENQSSQNSTSVSTICEVSHDYTEEPQGMLDPHFETQTYVIKDETGNKGLHTIKINHFTNLTVSPSFLEEQNIVVGIYHSHPDFVTSTISGISNEVVKDQPPPNETPFAIGYNDNVCYKDLDIPLMKIKLKVALVTLTKAKSLYLKFLLNSTDQKNQGHLKDAKEWHLLVIPISKSRAETIKNSSKTASLTPNECIPVSFLRIQVKTENRKNLKLQKQNRGVEIEWPIYQTTKRQRLEMEYFQKKKRKLAKISDQELEQKIAKMH